MPSPQLPGAQTTPIQAGARQRAYFHSKTHQDVSTALKLGFQFRLLTLDSLATWDSSFLLLQPEQPPDTASWLQGI